MNTVVTDTAFSGTRVAWSPLPRKRFTGRGSSSENVELYGEKPHRTHLRETWPEEPHKLMRKNDLLAKC
ncbi:hypothetical protein E2C01_002548 [Portunus trituberculatus]|uniref:Uncharacterized protein n=1 Tax=Portunus trituberculatus TaxID=210409 RepID=A0A5B7CLI5_PORTR|nr:hypothetical protein [Portunus trituberculatus]